MQKWPSSVLFSFVFVPVFFFFFFNHYLLIKVFCMNVYNKRESEQNNVWNFRNFNEGCFTIAVTDN